MTDQRIVLGFLLIGDGRWSGGLNYQRTVLQAIAASLSDQITARVIVAPDQLDLAQKEFGPWLEVPPRADPRVVGAGVGRRALMALATGRDTALAGVMADHDVDVVFETARFFGWRLAQPALAWMPDFQHRHLGHLFSRAAWTRREIGFRAQTRGRRIVLLSSEAARQDCEAFYPRARGRTAVARFAPEVDLQAIRARAETVHETYDLPRQFFYLPNQFWTHKNHGLVPKALQHLKDAGRLDGLPPVIMSGPQHDPRDPGLFERMLETAQAQGLGPWFRHLGLIPFEDVLALNAAAHAVLNPSLFEGWASSVEEAKALGSRLILSDIPVHREQAPGALFFQTEDFAALAAHLSAAAGQPKAETPLEALQQEGDARRTAFAVSFGAAVRDAFALGHPSHGVGA